MNTFAAFSLPIVTYPTFPLALIWRWYKSIFSLHSHAPVSFVVWKTSMHHILLILHSYYRSSVLDPVFLVHLDLITLENFTPFAINLLFLSQLPLHESAFPKGRWCSSSNGCTRFKVDDPWVFRQFGTGGMSFLALVHTG